MLAVWKLVTITIVFTQTHHSASSSCIPECQCPSDTIDCSNNDFSNIPSITAATGNWYVSLNMSYNRIQTIEQSAFVTRGYIALAILDFSNNNISDISPYAFTGLDKVKKLFLDHNNLLVLQEDVFEPLINLQELYLQRNKLSIILPHTISSLKKLIILDIRYNNLKCIDEGTFTNLSVLEKLRLMGNVIKSFAPEAFSPLKNLQYLELQLLETSREQEVLAPSKSEVTSCLCERKRALDWCHERRVNCLVTCYYSHEGQYDKDSNVCLNLLDTFSNTETAKNRTDSRSDLLWAVAIMIGVIFLLLVTLIILGLLFRKSKAHTGDENCSMVSNFDTYDFNTISAEHEKNDGDFRNEKKGENTLCVEQTS